jgi:selenoprotein W-related protein
MLERALNVEASILRQFGDKLERVSLVTGDHGIFVVRVDGEQIFDKDEDGFDVDEIVRRVKPHVGS